MDKRYSTVVQRIVHMPGALLIAFGENRYMGGQNASSLNVDFALTGATLKVDERTIVFKGDVVNAWVV